MQNHSIKIVVTGLALLALAVGCKRDQVQVYQIQEQAPPPQMAQATEPAMTNTALPPGHPDISGANAMVPAADNSASPLTWTMPTGWTEVPPSEMRVASFKVNQNGKMVDVSVIPLPGMAGTDSANVNRWRGQVGLPVATDDDLQKSAENVEAGGQPAQLYDVVGTNPASGDKTRIIAVIQHRSDATWFYKMTGDADLVEAQKPAFVEFLKSLKITGATAQATQGEMPATLPPGHPQIGDMNSAVQMSAPISHEGQPNWQVPSDWKEISGGQFLVAKFLINDGAAAVNVSSSVGDGGGIFPNENRWRAQLSLPPANSGLVGAAIGDTVTLDISGTDVQTGKPAQLIGIIVPQANRTWFYKLMGDPKTVAAQKDAFIKFVQSAKY